MPRTRTTRATTSTEPYAEPGLLLDIEVDDPTGYNRQKAERRHPCSECSKAFTTSGHLARHMKTHTGERAHKCPFPGCNTTCSRQDNLQQHYRVHLSPTSKRASNAENRAAIARARAAPNSRRRRTRDSQDEETSPVFVSQYNNPSAQPPSPPSSPPPLGEAHPDILTGRRPANPLPSGEQPVPIFVDPTPEQAMRLGLPMPAHQVPGAPPPPQAWIRAPSGALVPYDERRPYEALGYTNFLPYAARAPTQVTAEEQRQAQSWSAAAPPPTASSSSSSMTVASSSSGNSSMTLSPSYSTSTKRTSPPRAVYNPPQHLPSPRSGYSRPGFEREVLEKQAQQQQTHVRSYEQPYSEPLHGQHTYMSAPPPPTASSMSSSSTMPTHYAPPPQPFAYQPAPQSQPFAYQPAPAPPRPLQPETTLERFARMAESIPPPPPSRGLGGEDPFRQPLPAFGASRGPAALTLPPLRFREDEGLRLPPLGAPMQSTWPGHGVHVR